MRIALLLALVSAAACATTPPAPDPTPLQLDVVIASGGVTLYTSGTDLLATGCIGQDMFPAPGTTSTSEDTITCQHGSPTESCLTSVALMIAGTKVAAENEPPGLAMRMTGDVAAAGGGTLLIEGCGGSAEIDLPVLAAPTPTLSENVDTTAGTITSTWSAEPAAASALIEMNTGLWADMAHVTASPYTFTPPTGISLDTYYNVQVTTFAPPTIAASSFGPVHIWTGGWTMVFLQ